MVPNYVDLTGFEIGGAGYLGSSHNPFVVNQKLNEGKDESSGLAGTPDGFVVHDLTRKRELLAKVERGFERFEKTSRAREMSIFQDQALDILTAGKTRAALDVLKEKPKVIERYGSVDFGLSALAARRLVQAGVRFVTIGMRGWDTHGQNFAQLRNDLLPQLDRGLSALIEDLDAEGMLQETIVYCVGELNPHPHDQQPGWARSLGTLDERSRGRWRIQNRVRLRIDRRRGPGTGVRSLFSCGRQCNDTEPRLASIRSSNW